MNKKGKNIELKIYELLGVKIFRKMAFGLRDTLAFPLTLKMSKEERKKFLYNTASNYIMKKGNGLQDLRDFKKQLWLNAGIHIWALSLCLPNFLKVIGGTASTFTTIINLITITINIYCIMLQRYNCVRINEVIKKGIPREEKKKNEIKDELKQVDSLLKEHNYKIVNKRNKEKIITFDELLQNATLEQLREYRDYLKLFQKCREQFEFSQGFQEQEQQMDIKVPLEKNKKLKLELKLNTKSTKSAND